MSRELPLPPFFQEPLVGQLYRVPYQERADQARRFRDTHEIAPAAGDSPRVGLLLVDCQNTFCLPGGELFVAGRSGNGAVEDSFRLCRFLYAQLGRITEIVATLDTHTAIQVFHAHFFVDGNGEPPAAYSEVRSGDLESGRLRVNPEAAAAVGLTPEAMERHALHYCRRLEAQGKYALVVWPYHGMLGGVGHALVPAIEEAIFFHTIARSAQPRFEIKGRNPLTENYSVLRAEVLEGADGAPIAEPNAALVEHLLGYDALLVAGQAKSHCVAWTVADLAAEIARRDPDGAEGLARRVFLLEDATSPVVVPGADFSDAADAAFADFERAGMVRVSTGTPPEEWPGFPA